MPGRSWRWSCALVAVALALTVRSASGAEPNTLSPEELKEGWLLLFDGQTLFGWKAVSKANWAVNDGIISASEGEEGLLRTTSQFGDFALKVDFRAAKGTNSGVFLRTSPKPPDVTAKAYELNIAPPDNPFPTGSFVQRQKGEVVPESGDWQSYEVTAEGGHFVVRLNGRQVLDYTDRSPVGRGYIGLQFRSGKIEFRNIKLKPLGTKSLFNGKDLTGWKNYPDMKSVFSVTPEGWLNVKDGPGQLESAGQYGNLTLQLECIVNGKALNSGIFYRCIPGEKMNGYEAQICNSYDDGGKCGTGGIFRRIGARKIVAADFEWFQMAIHAVDNHVAVWVNGYQVTDWTDARKPDKNPRKGLRLDPGTLMIQGHDATTDLSFRNLRIAEIGKR